MTFAELKKEFHELEILASELKSSNEMQEKIITDKNQTILEITKAKEKLEKENRSLNGALDQLHQEKRILLQKLTNEVKVRIELESELILLHKEAEELPF